MPIYIGQSGDDSFEGTTIYANGEGYQSGYDDEGNFSEEWIDGISGFTVCENSLELFVGGDSGKGFRFLNHGN